MLDRLPAVTGTELTRDPRERATLWHLRKGLYTAVAGARPPGTTALLEDVAVPMPRLTGTCDGLIRLFDRHGYPDAVIFGHARDGNLHFMLTQSFDTPAEIDRYARFTDDMVDLVLPRAERSRRSTAPAGPWHPSSAGSTATNCTT